MDYTEVLRRLSVNDEQLADECARGVRINSVNADTTFGEPVTDFFVSPLAEQWTLADGYQG